MADVTVWGRADDGALVEVQLCDTAAEVDVAAWWPPMGLERVDGLPANVQPANGQSANVQQVDEEHADGDHTHGQQQGLSADATYRVLNDTSAAWDRLESDLGLFVAERLESLVAVHAAVIRADDVVLVIPGPSYAGKTSLCVAALDAGYDVLSDEYALVDIATGMVTGWPRRLRVRTPSGGAERVGDAVDHDPMAVDLIAEVTFSTDVDVLSVDELSAGETTLALLGNTLCASSRPEFAFAATLALGRGVAGVTGQRGEAAGALAALVDLARNPPAVS